MEIVEASNAQTRNEAQRHPHLGIVDFDQREVYIFDGIDAYRLELCIANLTDGTKIAYVKRYIEKASKVVEKEIKKAETAGQTRLNQPSDISIRNPNEKVKKISTTDSDGNQLTAGQQTYFSKSQERDADGNLRVMYRGDSEEVTVFDRKKLKASNLYGRGFYYTSEKSHAGQYGTVRAFYLNTVDPLMPSTCVR